MSVVREEVKHGCVYSIVKFFVILALVVEGFFVAPGLYFVHEQSCEKCQKECVLKTAYNGWASIVAGKLQSWIEAHKKATSEESATEEGEATSEEGAIEESPSEDGEATSEEGAIEESPSEDGEAIPEEGANEEELPQEVTTAKVKLGGKLSDSDGVVEQQAVQMILDAGLL